MYIRQSAEINKHFIQTMKRSITLLVALFFAAISLNAQSGITDEERKFALKYLTDSQNDMLTLMKGMSEAQLNFKTDADAWSISDCLKHNTISELNIWTGFVEAALAQEPDPSKRSEVKMSDEQIMSIIESRGRKVKTSAPFEPENMTESTKAAMKKFKKLRNEHIKWTKKTDKDLRNLYANTPLGTIDAYQAVLFMAGHTIRHTSQMRQIMADANFPKN